MKDALVAQRKLFDGQWETLSQLEDISRFGEDSGYNDGGIIYSMLNRGETGLISDEIKAEINYAFGLFRGNILKLGLEKHTSKIIDGIKRGMKSRIFLMHSDYSMKHIQQNTRANTDSYIQYGLDYIDRWAMYNNLFNHKEESGE
jgi:hypothetical protein